MRYRAGDTAGPKAGTRHDPALSPGSVRQFPQWGAIIAEEVFSKRKRHVNGPGVGGQKRRQLNDALACLIRPVSPLVQYPSQKIPTNGAADSSNQRSFSYLVCPS